MERASKEELQREWRASSWAQSEHGCAVWRNKRLQDAKKHTTGYTPAVGLPRSTIGIMTSDVKTAPPPSDLQEILCAIDRVREMLRLAIEGLDDLEARVRRTEKRSGIVG